MRTREFAFKIYWPLVLNEKWNPILGKFGDVTWKRSKLAKRRLGTIHKRRRQFFRIFDTPLPHVDSFLVLSISNFVQFLTPPPSQLPTSFMDAPYHILLRLWTCFLASFWPLLRFYLFSMKKELYSLYAVSKFNKKVLLASDWERLLRKFLKTLIFCPPLR